MRTRFFCLDSSYHLTVLLLRHAGSLLRFYIMGTSILSTSDGALKPGNMQSALANTKNKVVQKGDLWVSINFKLYKLENADLFFTCI